MGTHEVVFIAIIKHIWRQREGLCALLPLGPRRPGLLLVCVSLLLKQVWCIKAKGSASRDMQIYM